MKKGYFIFSTLAILLLSLVVAGSKPSYADTVRTSTEKINGRVYYDTEHLYTMHGTKDGQPWQDETASLAVQKPDGTQEMVFCVAPGVPLVGGNVTEGYEGVESGAVDKDALIAACIWQKVFPGKSQHEEIASRAVVWGFLSAYNLDIQSIDGIPEFPQLKAQLIQAVENYKKAPAFDGKTVSLKYGQTTKLDSGGVDLRDFNSVTQNTANVKFEIASDGMSANVTPTDPKNVSGRFSALKDFMYGTPIIWTHPASQTVVTPHIEDPTSFMVNFNVEPNNGQAKIVKIDKATGDPIPNTKFHVEFSGENAPGAKDVTTGSDGSASLGELADGVTVKATEFSVPEPYVLASANGGSDVVQGIVRSGETTTLTQKNEEETGKITVKKVGVESVKDLWNSNYTLKGNVFEIHKDSASGVVVQTITTDENGMAESKPTLKLGTYVVTEKQASEGFANTFRPQTVKIDYDKQNVPVVSKETSGDNQEVTGQTKLTKNDVETGAETQGKATFKGAQYTLYHADGKNKGQPVKWSESFKPVLATGVSKAKDNIVVEISDKNYQAEIKHLALGNYYWQETKAPEGYQIDHNQYNVALKYKDQNTQVITGTPQTSKENVIKLDLDGFKYVTSQNSSAQSGYNGIEFVLTPLEGTKGEQRSTTTVTDKNGYDGYFAFMNIPYGDYRISEVKAPDGFKMIKPLLLHSSFDEIKQLYTFTITEEGQKEPIKTLSISQDKINNGSNIVSLSKLFLYDASVEKPKIGTTLVNDNGDKVVYADGKVKLKDTISYKGMESRIGQELTATGVLTHGEGEPVKIDGKELVGTAKFTPQKDEGIAEVFFEFDASKLDAETVKDLTAFESVLDVEGNVIAEHKVPHEPHQTIKVKYPSVQTLATYKNGKKVGLPSKKANVVDKIEYKNLSKGQYFVESKAFDLQAEKFLAETTSEQKVSKSGGKGEWIIDQKINTIEASKHDIVYFEYVYSDKEKTQLIAKHEDKDSKEQTIKVKVPSIQTMATYKDGGKIGLPNEKSETIDKVEYKNLSKGRYFVESKALDLETGKFLAETTSEQKVSESDGKGEWIIDQKINTKEASEHDIVYFEYVYSDKEKTQLIAKHEDKESKEQTIKVEQPEIGTTLVNDSGDKVVYADGKIKLKDTIAYSKMTAEIGKELTATGTLTHGEGEPVKIDGKELVGTAKFTPEKSEGTVEVYFEFDASKLDAETIKDLTAFESVVDTEGTIIAEHKVPHEPHQTIEVKYPSIQTTATYKDGEKTAQPFKKAEVIDKVAYENLQKGKYYVETKALDLETDKFLADTLSEQEVKTSGDKGEWVIAQELNTKEASKHKIVYFEYVYSDKEKNNLVVKHEDKKSEDQTISVDEKAKPEIHTNAHNGDGKTQTVEAKEDTKVYDKISILGLVKDMKYQYDAQLHRIEGKDDKIVYKDTFDLSADKEQVEEEIDTKIDTSKDVDGVTYVWTEQLKDEDGEVIADHSDLNDKDETLTVKVPKPDKPQTPSNLETPSNPETPVQQKTTSVIPQTGEKIIQGLSLVGLVGLLSVAGVQLVKSKHLF